MAKMTIGYLRVSTKQQKTDRQISGMKALCDTLYIEKKSATAKQRPVFDQVLKKLNRGDTLVVWDMDRAFRSTEDAITHARELRQRGIEFQAMNFTIDTSSADGIYAYQVNAAAAEREWRKNSERTKQGLVEAVNRGQILGRPAKMTNEQIQEAIETLNGAGVTKKQVAAYYQVHPWTLTRSIRRWLKKQENV